MIESFNGELINVGSRVQHGGRSFSYPKGGFRGACVPHTLSGDFFFFIKAKFRSKQLALKEQEICLKKLEMAILQTQNFKDFWGSMPPDSPRKLAPTALVLPSPFESLGFAPVPPHPLKTATVQAMHF